MMKSPMTPLVLFFLIINALTIVFGQRLREKGFDTNLIFGGNLILFLTSAVSVYMYTRPGGKSTGHGAVRNIYGGFMLKFFVLIVAVMVYFFFASEINKGGIFACLGLYLVYNVIGTRQAVKKTDETHADDHTRHQKHRAKKQHHSHRKK